jgi:hypothetical protein
MSVLGARAHTIGGEHATACGELRESLPVSNLKSLAASACRPSNPSAA